MAQAVAAVDPQYAATVRAERNWRSQVVPAGGPLACAGATGSVRARPFLGICVGMQMLLDHSEEGDTAGLGLIPGEVRQFRLQGRLQADGSRFKVPQMGWNQVFHDLGRGPAHALWKGIEDGAYFYFVHSYYAQPASAQHSVGEADYGGRFAAAVARDNIFATQFHPEKSADQGLALYRNFLTWNP